MKTLLIDGDPIAWKATYQVQSGKDAFGRAGRSVTELLAKLQAARAIVCLSDPSRHYFRHDIFPAYKPRRSEQSPYLQDAIDGMAAVSAGGRCRALPALEADDVIGILATGGTLGGEWVIVADDKDLLTVPGVHYLPTKGKTLEISPEEAGCRHLLQTLTGDSSDGYPGCPGIGEKKAYALVSVPSYRASPAGAWSAVVAAFAAKGLTEADALLQARVARICQAGDYDLDEKRPLLWMPPERLTLPSSTPAMLAMGAA